MRELPLRADLYDDEQAAALRDAALSLCDARAAAVEIAARADALRHMGAAEAWRRQLAALEALQVIGVIISAEGLRGSCAFSSIWPFVSMCPKAASCVPQSRLSREARSC